MIMNKRGAGTITTLIITILTVMALFYGGFNYIAANYESANITDQLEYSESYEALQASQANLETNVDDIKTAAQNIAEADGNLIGVAWNGLTGIAATIRLFIGLIGTGVDVWNAIFPALAFLPTWIKVLLEIAVIATIVLLVIGAFKGESKT